MVKESRSYLALCSRVGGAHLARRHAPMHCVLMDSRLWLARTELILT